MTDTIKMTTMQGIRDAQKVEEREYREIEGTDIAVARGGAVFVDEDFPAIDDFPWMTVTQDDALRRAHVPAAVALAWLTPEERDEIRGLLPKGAKTSDPVVKELVARYQVWAWALVHVAGTDEDQLVVLDERPISSWAGKTIHRIEDSPIDDYKWVLLEDSRPPSRGGNTSAMHAHTIFIGDRKFSFWARGAKKFVFASDLATFDYYETEGGYLNVIRNSIVCRDAKGKVVRRGDRRGKGKLRSSPTRLPAARREWKD